MSKLLDDLIQQSRADTAAYEEFLRKAEELVRRLVARQPEQGVPAVLYGKRQATVIYNNLPQILAAGAAGVDGAAGEPGSEGEEARAQLALQIDQVMRENAPAGWKGDQAREAQAERPDRVDPAGIPGGPLQRPGPGHDQRQQDRRADEGDNHRIAAIWAVSRDDPAFAGSGLTARSC